MSRLAILRVENNLQQTASVSQINKNQIPVVAPSVYPTSNGNLLTD
jgi:hypothetical protein